MQEGLAVDWQNEGTIQSAWHCFKTIAQDLAEQHFQPPERLPRKPWITWSTLSLIEGRARLIAAGNWPALKGQNKLVKNSSTQDR
eukprot:10956398-Alexandrium_andersonii.AAC.1